MLLFYGGSTPMKILVVEDEKDLNLLIIKMLKKAGYSADGCCDGREALDYLAGSDYDAILLDVMMPNMNGYELLKKLRDRGDDISILMLTAKDAVEDRVKGLDLGADDYLIKPFSVDELLARIRAMTRKRNGNKTNLMSLEDLTIDISRRTVVRSGQEIQLIPKEFSILEYMMRNQGIVLSRERLENQIWNYEYSGSSNSVDVYMSRLRKKIDSGHEVKLLHTIRGVGWVLKADV